MSPLVSVVILNYNGKKWIDPCCPSLLQTTYTPVEWIYVDNASVDGSAEHLSAHFPAFHIIRNAANSGYAGGNNVGIRAARGKYIVLLNNDVKVEPEWLSRLVQYAESDASVGALQPKVRSMLRPGYFDYAGASGGWIDRWGYSFLRGRIFDTIEEDKGQYDDDAEIFWASGSAIFLRRSALDEAGLLDETMFMHFEEIDLCWRLHWSGFRICVVPSAVVHHYVGASLPAESFLKMYWNHRNSLITLVKNIPGNRLAWTLLVRMCLDGIAALRALVMLQWKRTLAILLAHFWMYTHIGLLRRKRRDAFSRHRVPESTFQHVIYRDSIVADYFLKKKTEFHILPVQN